MNKSTDQKSRKRIANQAVEWVLTLNEGSLSDDTLARWRSWIDTGPEYLAAYEKASRLWAVADELPLQSSVATPQPHQSWFWRWLTRPTMAALATACLVAGVWSIYNLNKIDTVQMVSVGMVSAVQTPTGAHKEYQLPDGSTIELGADTRIELAYSDTERRLRLVQGEALFDVARNPSRPFIVAAGAGEYRALGTTFNIQAGVKRSTLAVVEGVVQARADSARELYTGSNYPRLVAGESLVVSADGEMSDVSRVDLDAVLGWRSGIFTFVDVPLSEVFATVSRYRKIPIETSPALDDLRYTGLVRRDSIDSLLDILPEVFPVVVERALDKVIINPRS